MSSARGAATQERQADGHSRFAVLDGWRAVSILLVLATHMLPIGPKWMQLNSAAGPAGMSLFFTLSGFLITVALDRNPLAMPFLVRRVFRIVPLAFVAGSLILLLQAAPLRAYLPLWFFYQNYMPSIDGVDHVSHFWSLCVEMHFYVFVGTLVGMLGRRGLLVLPVCALGVTCWRALNEVPININTHLRVDEILAGASLALCYQGSFGERGRTMLRVVARVPLPVLVAVFAVSCHPASGPVQYLRPYAGASVVGVTLMRRFWCTPLLESRPLRYVAEISYALYVVHPASMMGWLGSGGTVERYLKRPLCFAITFGLAHLSTFHFERPVTEFGRKLARRIELRLASRDAQEQRCSLAGARK